MAHLEARRAVVIRSVGTARPTTAVAVAHGLGIPIDRTLQAIYRAPSLLVDDIEPTLADRLCQVLEGVGLETEVVETAPDLPPPVLFDVALHIRDAARAYDLAEAVAGFCACDTARALTLLTTPPGIVLGGVSRSTIEAFARQLPDGAADLVTSDPATASYMVIYAGESPTIRSKLEKMLALQGPVLGNVVASEIDYTEAQRVWASFGRTGSVRIVNRDFLRFEIWLDGTLDDVGSDESRIEALAGPAGIPADRAPELLSHAPFVLEEGIATGHLEPRMRRYAEAGLRVRAELTTFQNVALELVAVEDPQRLASAARRLGFPERLAPPCLTGPMPETHARIARAVLEAAGAEVYFAEAAHG